MGTLGSSACEGAERANAGIGVDGREPDPSLVVARKLGVDGCEASSSTATLLNVRQDLPHGNLAYFERKR